MAKVFLSYDREDTERAAAIAGYLENAGHSVWWDRKIRGGAQFVTEIERELQECHAVVVLWSKASIHSEWVRDEAVEGRDRGKFLPVLLDPVKPPMGFRQYQTVDLTDWSREPSVRAQVLLDALAQGQGSPKIIEKAPEKASRLQLRHWNRNWLVASAVLGILFLSAFGWIWQVKRAGPTVVSVVAADGSVMSQRFARDLLVKLGQLRSNDAVDVTLIDESDRKAKSDLRFSVSGISSRQNPSASVALLSSGQSAVLWSKVFEQPGTSIASLQEQIGIASARVLGCVVEESSADGHRLEQGVRRTFLNACAAMAESGWDKRSVIPLLRQVVDRAPRFQPAWSRLVLAEADLKTFLESSADPYSQVVAQLRADIESARALNPDMAEIRLAELALHPAWEFGKAIAVLDEAKANHPENGTVLSTRALWLQSVGRMQEAIEDSERAARVDPLSANVRSEFIRTLAYGGKIDRARKELAAAKRLWPEAESVLQTEYSIERRFGDFERAILSEENDPAVPLYVRARRDPSDANVGAFLANMQASGMDGPHAVFALQALGEMKRIDDFFALAAKPGIARSISRDTYALFRPWLIGARRDPRFMRLAKQLGLVDYWRASGKWPDFCREPELPYDCRAEAAKLRD